MINNELYINDVRYVAALNLPWEFMKGKTIMITGASGMIGSAMIDVIMYRNMYLGMDCTVYGVGRDIEKGKKRFIEYWNNKNFQFISHDINLPFSQNMDVDYIVHLASNTHPVAYSTDPVGTITTNIIGTNNLLNYAVLNGTKRFMFASSNEIYGENKGDIEFFDEHYCGYIDSNTLRAGYPESKRCGEALCQAYKAKKNLDVVIPRLTRSYGPTMLMSDTKAISQFIRKGIAGENIILKSEGKQYYSYTYMMDAVAGLLTILLNGKNGEAYNIADESGDIILKDLAMVIAGYAGTEVVFEVPDEIEKVGYSTATKARLDGSKIRVLGWKPQYDINNGVKRTMDILRHIM